MTSSDSTDLLLNKYCNELNSDDKKQRRRAIENIRKEIFARERSDQIPCLYDKIQKQIVRCFKDNVEAVREAAVLLVTDILKLIPAKYQYIDVLMPVISERLSGDIILENSEEVRLCLILLLQHFVSNYTDHLFQYLNDFICILTKTIVDPYPKVKKESCDCAAGLAKAIPQRFHMQSESLISPLIQTLTHQQYRIRVAGVKSIGAVVCYGNNKSVADVCGPLAERLFDQHHAVRAAVAEVVGFWLLQLPDRYSYFYRLLPLMLTSLSEEIPEQRQKAEELWNKAGLQYMQENENDLKDKMDFLKETLDHYPPNARRPNLGCRTLVQRELSRYLPAVAAELDDWKADIRVKSAQLMCVTVQHAENCITQHLEKTLPPLYRACGDSDNRVVVNIELAAEMLGYFVPPDVYWRLMKSSVQESTGPGPMRILAAILRTSLRSKLHPQLTEIADTLVADSICHSRQGYYQKQLLNVVDSLQKVSMQDVQPITKQLFTVLISVLGLASDPSITTQAQGLLEGLASLNEVPLQKLYKVHTPSLLEKISDSVKEWTSMSPQHFIFEALLTHAGTAIGENINVILTVLEACLQPEREPEAILQMLMAVSYILTHSEETLSEITDLPSIIHHLCTKVLQPQLVWRAGRSAEALRTAATGCVLAALELKPCSRALAEQLIPLLLGLLEDSAYKTRQFASLALLTIAQSLRKSESLCSEDINRIFVVVMKRLDDNNDKVREITVQVLCELFRKPLPTDYNLEWYRAHLESLFDTMLLHLDDPNPSFQETMLSALKEISSTHPPLLKSRIKLENFRSKTRCEELIKFLNNLHLEDS